MNYLAVRQWRKTGSHIGGLNFSTSSAGVQRECSAQAAEVQREFRAQAADICYACEAE